MNENLTTLIAETATLRAELNTTEQAALDAERTAIDTIIAALQTALAGRNLLGAPDISPWRSYVFHAYRVRATLVEGGSIPEPGELLPEPKPSYNYETTGQQCLCLSPSGKLIIAYTDIEETDSVSYRQIRPDDIKIGDSERLAMLLEQVLPVHVEQARAQHQRYKDARMLAEKIKTALQPERKPVFDRFSGGDPDSNAHCYKPIDIRSLPEI